MHPDTVLCLFCDVICRDFDAAMPVILQHIEPTIPDKGRKVEQNDCKLKDSAKDLPNDADTVDSPVVLPGLYQLSHWNQIADVLGQRLVLGL